MTSSEEAGLVSEARMRAWLATWISDVVSLQAAEAALDGMIVGGEVDYRRFVAAVLELS